MSSERRQPIIDWVTALRRGILAIVAAAAVAAFADASVSADPDEPTPGHVHVMKIFKGQRAGRPTKVVNLSYHGGPVETAPAIYIVFWGTWWNSGVTTGSQGGYTYKTSDAQTYISSFFGNVGGSAWNNTVTQYCQAVAFGSTSCTSGTHIQNPTSQLVKSAVDASPVPSSPSQGDIAAEAQRAATTLFHLTASSQPGATIFVFTPSQQSMNGFGSSWCAWHSVTTFPSSTFPLPYAYIPYMPDAGAACGQNFVNSSANAFGNGYFDGFSIVGGHEYAEAETDPVTSPGSYAWYDQQGQEIADKCAWSSSSINVPLGSNNFAVQPLWSNATSNCAISS